MNRISFEKKAAKKYMLKTIKSDCACLVNITPNNVAMVEAMIQNDSAYLNAANSQLGPDKNGNVGSTAYCMCQLKNYINNKETDKKLYKKIISDAVIAVDRDNSTHLNADGIGRKQITKRIFKLSPEQLIYYLKAPKETNYKLFKIISKKQLIRQNQEKTNRLPVNSVIMRVFICLKEKKNKTIILYMTLF